MCGKNDEKYIPFSAPIKKENNNGKTITYKLKFIDSFRFMSASLSDLVDNLSDRFHEDKCKDCKSKLSYMSVKDNQLIFQCFECKKNYEKEFDMELVKKFSNMYNFARATLINLFCC